MSTVSELGIDVGGEFPLENSPRSQEPGRSSAPGLLDLATTLMNTLRSAGAWIAQRAKTRQANKKLRVCETVALGERRFVAVIQVDQERFLIGGSSSQVCLLTRLKEATGSAKTFQGREAEGRLQ